MCQPRHTAASVTEKLLRLQQARLAEECAKLQRPVEQAAAEEFFRGEAESPEYNK